MFSIMVVVGGGLTRICPNSLNGTLEVGKSHSMSVTPQRSYVREVARRGRVGADCGRGRWGRLMPAHIPLAQDEPCQQGRSTQQPRAPLRDPPPESPGSRQQGWVRR